MLDPKQDEKLKAFTTLKTIYFPSDSAEIAQAFSNLKHDM
jgi:hypothetical protein